MNLYVSRLADGLAALGVHADVFTRADDARAPLITQRPSGSRIIQLSAGPARSVPKRILPLHIPAMVRALRSFLECHRTQYDVWHSHYWLSGMTAMRVRDDPRVPIVHMFHTLSKVKQEYLGEADDRDSALREDGERCLIGAVDVVVGATDGEKQLMGRLYGRTPAWFEVIPPGVDLDHFRPHDRRDSRARLGLGEEPVILFVGRLNRIKGLDLLLQATAHAQRRLGTGVQLVVVGGYERGKEPVPRQYRRLVRALGIEDCVEFRGIVSQEDLPYYYSAADVCAMPSAYESFGMVALESMACETPVVAFSVGGLAETIQHGRTGFLAPPGNAPAFEAELLGALRHPDLASVGRRGRTAARRHDWTEIVERTLTVYERSSAARSYIGSAAAGGC